MGQHKAGDEGICHWQGSILARASLVEKLDFTSQHSGTRQRGLQEYHPICVPSSRSGLEVSKQSSELFISFCTHFEPNERAIFERLGPPEIFRLGAREGSGYFVIAILTPKPRRSALHNFDRTYFQRISAEKDWRTGRMELIHYERSQRIRLMEQKQACADADRKHSWGLDARKEFLAFIRYPELLFDYTPGGMASCFQALRRIVV